MKEEHMQLLIDVPLNSSSLSHTFLLPEILFPEKNQVYSKALGVDAYTSKIKSLIK